METPVTSESEGRKSFVSYIYHADDDDAGYGACYFDVPITDEEEARKMVSATLQPCAFGMAVIVTDWKNLK